MLNVICSTGKTVKEKLTPTRNSEKNQSLNFVVRRANEFSIGLFQVILRNYNSASHSSIFSQFLNEIKVFFRFMIEIVQSRTR